MKLDVEALDISSITTVGVIFFQPLPRALFDRVLYFSNIRDNMICKVHLPMFCWSSNIMKPKLLYFNHINTDAFVAVSSRKYTLHEYSHQIDDL